MSCRPWPERNLHPPRLTQVRDIFLFSCYTGLAYADVKKRRTSEVVWSVDGEKWLMVRRQKTDTFSCIPLLPAWIVEAEGVIAAAISEGDTGLAGMPKGLLEDHPYQQ